MFGNFETVANNIWKSIKHPVTETLIRNGNMMKIIYRMKMKNIILVKSQFKSK